MLCCELQRRRTTSTVAVFFLLSLLLLMSSTEAYKSKLPQDNTEGEDGTGGAVEEEIGGGGGDFSYLDVLTETDLKQMLQERNVRVSSFASKDELRRLVIQSERQKEQEAAKNAIPTNGHKLRVLYCTG